MFAANQSDRAYRQQWLQSWPVLLNWISCRSWNQKTRLAAYFVKVWYIIGNVQDTSTTREEPLLLLLRGNLLWHHFRPTSLKGASHQFFPRWLWDLFVPVPIQLLISMWSCCHHAAGNYSNTQVITVQPGIHSLLGQEREHTCRWSDLPKDTVSHRGGRDPVPGDSSTESRGP